MKADLYIGQHVTLSAIQSGKNYRVRLSPDSTTIARYDNTMGLYRPNANHERDKQTDRQTDRHATLLRLQQ